MLHGGDARLSPISVGYGLIEDAITFVTS